MGLYATTTALQVKMVGTVFDTATTSLVSVCITDAENEVKKKLSPRYDFSVAPFLTYATVPPVITTIVETLALGFAYENMSRGSKEGFARADRFIKRAMDNLDAIAKGDADLVTTANAAVSEDSTSWTVHATENYSNTFNEDDATSWAVDSDKLSDIENSRS